MKKYKRIVIKIGTKVIASKGKALEHDRIRDIVNQICDLKDRGISVILVTSGAIGAGMGLLGLKKRPTKLEELQATAAIGQGHLMHLYNEYFRERHYLTGQVLLTQEDLNDRTRYLSIKHTIATLLSHKAVPIVNENDTVSTEEIRCGDNDRLSSLVSDLCEADLLVMLTDVDGLLDRADKVVPFVEEIDQKVLKLGGASHCDDLGTGGMATKLAAARYTTEAGIDCIVANGRKGDAILRIFDGKGAGTFFKARAARHIARKRWIAFSSKPKGAICVDIGAKEALTRKDKSLLASGIRSVEGNFASGDVVSIIDEGGIEFARGVTAYSSGELVRIKGLKTRDFKAALGRTGQDEIVHKDNLVIL